MKLSSIVLGIALSIPSLALAQSPPPNGLPGGGRPALSPAESSGAIHRYIVGPGGHVRGFVLSNGAVVFLRGPEGDGFAARAHVGDTVRVQGVAMQGVSANVIHRATVTAADGSVLVAAAGFPGGGMHAHRGPEGEEGMQRPEALPAYAADGTIESVVPGPRGEVHALLLTNNTTVLLPRSMANALHTHGVQPGQHVAASGRGGSFPVGASVLAERLTLADGTVLTATLVGAGEPEAPHPPE